jgi:hypothetical protein
MPAGTVYVVGTTVLIGRYQSVQEALDPDTGEFGEDELEPKLNPPDWLK